MRQSSEAIKQSGEAIASLTGTLNGLSPERPGAHVALILAGAGVLAFYAILIGLVLTMMGIRRSLRRIETAMAQQAGSKPD